MSFFRVAVVRPIPWDFLIFPFVRPIVLQRLPPSNPGWSGVVNEDKISRRGDKYLRVQDLGKGGKRINVDDNDRRHLAVKMNRNGGTQDGTS